VAMALTTIRDRRLYRDSHKTFGAYCRRKWDYKKSHVCRLIAAAQVLSVCPQLGTFRGRLTNLRSDRYLGLEPDKVREVWKKAVAKADGLVIKAAVVKEVAREFQPRKATRPANRPKRPAAERRSRILNCLADLEQAIRADKGKEALLKLPTRAKVEVARAGRA
jgi:hypothetical protein